LDKNLPPILSGLSFPFDEVIHRYNHIGNLDHNGHSTVITSTYSTSTEPDMDVHAAEHRSLEEMSPKCTPLSWMHHHQKEEPSPKCVPLSWMHTKDRPSEKAHTAHAEMLDLLPPFSLPFSLPLHPNEDVGKLKPSLQHDYINQSINTILLSC